MQVFFDIDNFDIYVQLKPGLKKFIYPLI